MPANLTTKLGQLVDVLTPDTTNTRIGVANASPTRTLDVTGTFGASGASTLGGTLTAAAANFSGLITGSAKAVINPATTPTTAATATQLGVGEATNNASYRLNLGYWIDGGIYRGNIDAITGGNAATLTLNSTGGLVGIGMTPSNILDITQNQNAASAISILNTNAGAASQSYYIATNGTTSVALQMFGTGYTTSGVSRQSGAILQCTGAGGLTLNTVGAQPIYFGINSVEKARFDTSGNLLLGTTTAQALLTVKGATQIIGTGSSTAGGSGPSSGKITKQATSSTSTNSVTVTGTGFSNAAWVNGVIKITAAGGTIYSSNQSGIFAVYSFQGLAGTAPRNFTLMGTAMTAGGTITISFASSTSETLVVTASMSDGSVPGSIPSQNMSMTVEVDYGYPFTLS